MRDAPTSFGLLSYSIRSTSRSIRVAVDVPAPAGLRTLRLRLRLPKGERIVGARSGSAEIRVLGETVDLPTRPRRIELEVRIAR